MLFWRNTVHIYFKFHHHLPISSPASITTIITTCLISLPLKLRLILWCKWYTFHLLSMLTKVCGSLHMTHWLPFLINLPREAWTRGIVLFSGPGNNQTAPWNIFTLQLGGELGILNAAPASLGSANLITFWYQRGKKMINISCDIWYSRRRNLKITFTFDFVYLPLTEISVVVRRDRRMHIWFSVPIERTKKINLALCLL